MLLRFRSSNENATPDEILAFALLSESLSEQERAEIIEATDLSIESKKEEDDLASALKLSKKQADDLTLATRLSQEQ